MTSLAECTATLRLLSDRFGTHSGWLEACRDPGTTVMEPTCRYFAEQGPVLSYDHGVDDSLTEAVPAAWHGTLLG